MPGIAIGSTTNNRYQVLHCIAHSASTSSVWLVRDLQNSTYKCLKARRSNDILPPPCGCPSESVFLRPPHEAMGGPHPGQAHINALVDSFTLAEDAEGDKLECMVSSLFGPSVKTLCHPHRVSLPWNVMKQVTVQLLMALWYLHSVKGVVHADIHMRNILLHPPKDHKDYTSTIEKFLNTLDPKEDTMGPIPFPLPDVDNVHVALVDFDLAHLVSNAARHDFIIQPPNLRAPEVILGAEWSTPADIWNLGQLIFEMATSRRLFPAAKDDEDDTAQLGCMVRYLGDFPSDLLSRSRCARKYFNSNGRLKGDSIEPQIPLEEFIVYLLTLDEGRPTDSDISHDEAVLFADFIVSMLQLNPEDRADARELLQHAWLRDTLEKYADRARGSKRGQSDVQGTSSQV